ncbi:MAG: phosphatase PAP2 family protein [Lachnospiraceae bacterium]|nr:phosphatase PAP2 family protein [Lachnospiraceae bacterium]
MAVELSPDWEARFLLWLQTALGETGSRLLGVFSIFGEPAFIFFVFSLLYFGYRKETAIRAGTVVLMSLLWNPMIKNAVRRLRPYMVHPEIVCYKPAAAGNIYDPEVQGYSFPSGHATVVSSLGGAVSRLFRKKWIWILSAAVTVLTALSRMAVGVHYPTDVVFGIVLGIVSVIAVNFLEARIRDRRVLFLILALTTVPGFFYCTSEDFFSCAGLLYGFFLGSLYEERIVRFGDLRSPVKILVRVLLGAVLVIGISQGLKALFSLLPGELPGKGIMRTIRYFLAAFAMTGLYPLCFRRLRLEDTDIEAET